MNSAQMHRANARERDEAKRNRAALREKETKMDQMTLNGSNWRMRIVGAADVYGVNGKELPAKIPGSVYGNLLEQGLMPDPYYRMNELEALRLMENDFVFETDFTLTEKQLAGDFLILRFEGIDTLAKVYLNGRLLGGACNMHRVWEYPIESAARVGENALRVEIASPTRFIEEENEKVFTGGSTDAMRGFPHLRKTHCMFGWDWGPRLPDAGIFREVSVLSGKMARIEKVYITQKWNVSKSDIVQNHGDRSNEAVYITKETERVPGSTADSVDITFDIACGLFGDIDEYGDGQELRIALYDPDGVLVAEGGGHHHREKSQTLVAQRLRGAASLPRRGDAFGRGGQCAGLLEPPDRSAHADGEYGKGRVGRVLCPRGQWGKNFCHGRGLHS